MITLTPAGVPPDAVMITYQPRGKRMKHVYYVWGVTSHWYWQTVGNNGQASSRYAAEWMCRNWIDKGLAGRPR